MVLKDLAKAAGFQPTGPGEVSGVSPTKMRREVEPTQTGSETPEELQ